MNFLMSSFLFALQMCVGSHSSVLAMLTEIRMCTLSYVSPSVTTCFWALIKYDSKPYKIMCGYVFASCCGRVRVFFAHRSLQSRPCNRGKETVFSRVAVVDNLVSAVWKTVAAAVELEHRVGLGIISINRRAFDPPLATVAA